MDGRPLVLTLGYFRCASLCGVLRANLLLSLEQAHLVAGRDFSFAALSIDPLETLTDAATIKAKELEGHPTFKPEDFHFLTGDREAIADIAEHVGFKSRALQENRFAHPLGVVFVSPNGVISSYLLGISYPPDALRLAARRAAAGETAPAASPLLLLCYDLDAATGRYTFAIMKFLRVASAAIAGLALAALARIALGERLRL
jgi:protein SCO1